MANRIARRPTLARPVKKMDNKVWQYSSGGFTGLSASTVAAAFATVGSLPTTLLRLRGNILCVLDGVDEPGPSAEIQAGIILVPEGSAATVQYDPGSDENAPWLWYTSFTIAYEEPVANVVSVPAGSGFREVVDNKAMRKIRPDVEMQIAVANTTIGAALTVSFFYNIRWLQGF